MSFGQDNYPVAETAALTPHQPPTVTERLEQEKKDLELRLKAVTELLDDLKSQPETMAILDKLSVLGHRIY